MYRQAETAKVFPRRSVPDSYRGLFRSLVWIRSDDPNQLEPNGLGAALDKYALLKNLYIITNPI